MVTRVLLPLLAVAALGFALVRMTAAQQKPPPAVPPVEPARSPFTAQLAGAGLVEPETENISIGSHLSGVIERVYVRVGDVVRPGQPLFRLDERNLKAELEVRLANLANAEAALEKLNNTPRPEELPPLRAKVAESEANLIDQAKQLDRLRRAAAAASEDEITRREAGVDMAKAQLAKAKADLALSEAGAWKYDKRVAETAVMQARASVESAKTELGRLTVSAPRFHWQKTTSAEATADDTTEFKVLQVNVRPGEFVGNIPGQGLVMLGHVGRLHIRVDVDENDIGRFRPNLRGVANPRGTPDKEFPISFVRIEPYVIPKKSLTGANTERVDTRVLQVIYAVETKGAPLYVGQQMDVFLDTAK
jgi:multidrug efflux pump subunit AcrA (membrane-fusion protein)